MKFVPYELSVWFHWVKIFQVKYAYADIFGKDLEQHIISESSGGLQQLFLSLLTANRTPDSVPVDVELARREASQLIDAGILALRATQCQSTQASPDGPLTNPFSIGGLELPLAYLIWIEFSASEATSNFVVHFTSTIKSRNTIYSEVFNGRWASRLSQLS